MQPVAPTKLGPYRVVRKLGEGGMGAVFEAEHERLQKRVAVKVLHAPGARDAEVVTRFLREGRAASRVRHPHILDITDVGVEDGAPYLVMELLHGESLASLLARIGTLSIPTIADIALPVLDALDAAHAAGIVHRDLKPENLFLVDSRGGGLHPVVLDFGISKIEDDVRLTRPASFIGTPHYMSPEQTQDSRNIDARSDQFSLGLVLHEMATGRRALGGDSALEVIHRLTTQGVPRLAKTRPDLPPAFTRMVDRMTEARRDARYGSMREIGAEMIALASPRAVALWGGAFGRSPGSSFGTAPTARSDAPPPRSSSSGPSSAAGSRPSSSTTLSGAARAISAPAPARSSPMLLPLSIAVAVLGVALFAAGTYAALGVITGRSTETGAATSPPVASPSAAPPPLAAAAPAQPAATSPSLPSAASPTPSAARTMELRIRAIPATAEILLDGALVANGTFARTLACDGIPHMLEVRAAGYVPQHIQFLDIAPISEITLERIPRHHRGPVVATRFEVTSRGLVTVPAGSPQIATTIAPRPAAAPVEAAVAPEAAPTAAAVIAPPAEPAPAVAPAPPPSEDRPLAAREERPAAPAPAPTWISGDEELMPFE